MFVCWRATSWSLSLSRLCWHFQVTLVVYGYTALGQASYMPLGRAGPNRIGPFRPLIFKGFVELSSHFWVLKLHRKFQLLACSFPSIWNDNPQWPIIFQAESTMQTCALVRFLDDLGFQVGPWHHFAESWQVICWGCPGVRMASTG